MKLKVVLVLSAVALLAGCSFRRASEAAGPEPAQRFPELDLKERLQREISSPAALLTPRRSVSNGQGAELVVPSGVAYSDVGDLYVADNNTHAVHVWRADPASAGSMYVTPGAPPLRFPNAVQVWRGNLFISDNDGIKVLSRDGRFERLMRTYYEVFSFAVSERGTIFASTVVRNPEARDPLIIEMDQMGRVIRRFGSRRPSAGDRENHAFVALADDLLFVAFKYRPAVEVYDTNSGDLVRSFEIRHPVFAALAGEAARPKAAAEGGAEQNLVPRYIAGLKTLGGRVFLCLHLPVPEVWEVNKEGEPLAEFRADGLPAAIHVFGFDARLVGGRLHFAIGITDAAWGAAVSEFTSTSD